MNLSKSCLVVILLLLCNGAKSQNVVTDTTATIVSYWQKGDKVKYELTTSKDKYEKGKLISGGGSTTIVEISVIDATEKSYTLDWKYEKVKMADQAIAKAAQPFTQLVEGLNFRYRTSELGEFQELLNWKEVQATVYTMIDKLVPEADDSAMALVLRETKKIFGTKTSMEELLLKDVQLLHSLYGGEYKLKEVINVDTELPNMLGGNPFPAKLRMEMVSLDKAYNRCSIKMTQSIDKEKATKELSDWAERLGKSKDITMPLISMTDMVEFDVELVSGWMNRAYFNRTVEMDDRRNVEVHELKKIKN